MTYPPHHPVYLNPLSLRTSHTPTAPPSRSALPPLRQSPPPLASTIPLTLPAARTLLSHPPIPPPFPSLRRTQNHIGRNLDTPSTASRSSCFPSPMALSPLPDRQHPLPLTRPPLPRVGAGVSPPLARPARPPVERPACLAQSPTTHLSSRLHPMRFRSFRRRALTLPWPPRPRLSLRVPRVLPQFTLIPAATSSHSRNCWRLVPN